MLSILVDADGCPVKEEVYRVARRYKLDVRLVANSWMRAPNEDWIELVVVGDALDAADDWIAEHVAENDVVITADIPLASRCLKKGAAALDHKGGAFDENTIGHALAGRELMSQLRDMGTITGGPAPFTPRNRSNFLQRLDQAVNAALRKA